LDSSDDEARAAPVVQAGVFGVAYSPVSRLRVVAREAAGKRHAQWTRVNGLIPSLVYGGGGAGGAPQRVYVAEKALRALVRARGQSFLSSLVDLEMADGTVVRALPRDFQVHPFRDKYVCINWLRYRPGRYPGTKVDLPLVAVNEERCPAYRDGAWLLDLQHKVPVWCSGDRIPDYLTMDLRGKKLGEKIMASELELGEGVALVRRGCCARARGFCRRPPPLFPRLRPLTPPLHTHTHAHTLFSSPLPRQQRFTDHDFAVAKFIGSKKGGAAEAAEAAPAAKEKKKAEGGDKKPAEGAAAAKAPEAAKK